MTKKKIITLEFFSYSSFCSTENSMKNNHLSQHFENTRKSMMRILCCQNENDRVSFKSFECKSFSWLYYPYYLLSIVHKTKT